MAGVAGTGARHFIPVCRARWAQRQAVRGVSCSFNLVALEEPCGRCKSSTWRVALEGLAACVARAAQMPDPRTGRAAGAQRQALRERR